MPVLVRTDVTNTKICNSKCVTFFKTDIVVDVNDLAGLEVH